MELLLKGESAGLGSTCWLDEAAESLGAPVTSVPPAEAEAKAEVANAGSGWRRHPCRQGGLSAHRGFAHRRNGNMTVEIVLGAGRTQLER